MPRTKGSKNKNTNTAKNKNIININVNTSKTKKGRGRPRKQNNDTTQFRQSGGGGMMAPPQVIISQPTPQQDNSLLNSFITSKFLSESMNQNRTNMTNIEQPTNREQPSYFNARESIIPKLPETPISKTVIRPADITPSTIIKTKEPQPVPEPPKIDIKPTEVAPPTRDSKLFQKLKDTASTVANAASSELGTSIIEHALNGVDQTHIASTLIGSVLRGHRGRKNHALKKQYPELVNERLEDVKRMEPLNTLTYQPVEKDEKTQYLQLLEKRREKDKTKLEKELSKNAISQDLQNTQTPIQKKAATTLQTAIRQKIAKNKVADKYIEKQNKARSILTDAIKSKIARKDFKEAQNIYNPEVHQENIREKRKEFARIITTKATSKQAKEDAQKSFKKTNYVFKRKSNAGRPPKNKYLNVNELEV